MRMLKVRKQQGQVFLIVAISMVVLVGTIGLAIDSGLGYMSKAKLNAAVDSAVIAAARAVTQGNTQAQQTANAKQAAHDFFDANYPAGYLGSNPVFPDPTIVFNGGQVTVDASATAAVPVTFMRIMNFSVLNVAAAAQTVRKDLDLAFVMDTSGSMSSVAAQVRAASVSFLDKFNPTIDRVALMHFSYGAVVDVPFKADQSRGFDRDTPVTGMKARINALGFGGLTNSSEGLWNARDQLNTVIAPANRSSLRVIVFFSDGAPNTFASFFTFKVPAECSAAGSLITGDGTGTGTPQGLWEYNQQSQQKPPGCYQGNNITSHLTATALPLYYNAHNPTNLPALQEFPVITATPRVVTNDTSTTATTWVNVNRASRNLVEAMAAKSRAEGIYVFTLGLGDQLLLSNGPPPSDKGEDLLKCMANVPGSLPRCVTAGAGQPIGVYCHAATANELKPCFDKLASAILRITK